MLSPSQPSMIRFGAFELDAASGELRKAGVRLKMGPQQCQLLRLLAERPGQIVTRQEIQRCIWGENTFVDFDRGINFCVNRIRATLGDDAERPRYIETLPRRGYRFIARIKAGVRPASRQTLKHKADSGFRSLAVLPFQNLTADPERNYFADGMTEALITELGKIGTLRVISRQSVMQYRNTNKSVPQIAADLKLDAVVEGSVLSCGDRVCISVQLIEARPERHLWAESYERQARDILGLHSEIARTVARQIKATLTPEEEKRLVNVHAVNPAANDAYLQGRFFLDRRTKQDLDKALVDFQQAIELDPTFAPAYASLSEACLSLVLYNPDRQPELLGKARTASLKALELDESLSAAHYTLAANGRDVWDWSGAEVQYKRAIELNPSNASAHWWYADLLIIQGRLTEAERELQRAAELNPVSLGIYATATAFRYFARRYDDFIEHCRGWVKRNPDCEWNYHHGLGAAYVQMGKHKEAIAELRQALKSSTMFEHTATELAHALAAAGKREEALELLGRVENVPWKTFGAALVHTGLRENEKAFRCLEKAIDLRAPFVLLLKVDPRFDHLRADQRFRKLLRRLNLPA